MGGILYTNPVNNDPRKEVLEAKYVVDLAMSTLDSV